MHRNSISFLYPGNITYLVCESCLKRRYDDILVNLRNTLFSKCVPYSPIHSKRKCALHTKGKLRKYEVCNKNGVMSLQGAFL